MSYAKTNWIDGVTPANATNMNKIEQGIEDLDTGKEPSITVKNSAFNQNFETANSNIKMNGVASAGTSNNVSKADHVHPSDTSKANTTDLAITNENVSTNTDNIASNLVLINSLNLQLQEHKDSTTAHDAENIAYSGEVVASDVKGALDKINERVGTIVAGAGASNTEILDARYDNINSKAYNTLGARMDGVSLQLAEMVNLNSNIIYNANNIKNIDVFLSALRNKSCKVAFWGDSITAGANAIDSNITYVNTYMDMIINQFPNVIFTKANYGISGRTIADAANSSYTSPTYFSETWSTTDGKAWRDYVKDYNPDLLVIAFGMNVQSSTMAYNLQLIKDYIDTWTKKPSILFITNYLPLEEWATESGRIDRINQMRSTRSWAKNRGYTILDIGDNFRKLVDGITENEYIPCAYKNFDGYTGDSQIKTSEFYTKNFILSFSTVFSPTTNISIAFGKENVLKITNGVVEWYTKTTLQATESWTIADGSKALYITRNEETITVSCNSITLTLTVFNDFRDGQIIIQKIGENIDFTNFVCIKYDNAIAKSLLTNEDVLGLYDANDVNTTKLPYGGNGVNHPSSKMIEFIFKPIWNKFLDGVKIEIARQVNVPYVAIPKRLLSSAFNNVATTEWGTNGGLNSNSLQIKFYNLGTTLTTKDKNYLRKISDGSYLTYRPDIIQGNCQLLNTNEYAIVLSGTLYLLLIVTPETDYDFYETKYNLITQ